MVLPDSADVLSSPARPARSRLGLCRTEPDAEVGRPERCGLWHSPAGGLAVSAARATACPYPCRMILRPGRRGSPFGTARQGALPDMPAPCRSVPDVDVDRPDRAGPWHTPAGRLARRASRAACAYGRSQALARSAIWLVGRCDRMAASPDEAGVHRSGAGVWRLVRSALGIGRSWHTRRLTRAKRLDHPASTPKPSGPTGPKGRPCRFPAGASVRSALRTRRVSARVHDGASQERRWAPRIGENGDGEASRVLFEAGTVQVEVQRRGRAGREMGLRALLNVGLAEIAGDTRNDLGRNRVQIPGRLMP